MDSSAMCDENYLTSDFHTNSYFKPVCLLVKMASKTVIRPIKTQHKQKLSTDCGIQVSEFLFIYLLVIITCEKAVSQW